MKLSEAIRLGSLLKPQAFGNMWVGSGSCAFGAALDALGITKSTFTTVADTWPWLKAPMNCPACGEPTERIARIISTHLNDAHRWTREKIAAWVATVEPQEIEAGEIIAPEAVEVSQ
jgi:hypothetical protein